MANQIFCAVSIVSFIALILEKCFAILQNKKQMYHSKEYSILFKMSMKRRILVEQTIYYQQRQEGYQRVLAETAENSKGRTAFENTILCRLYEWWANWKPDYEGWLKCADSLYAQSAIIDAIGKEPQKYMDYRASMKGQRDAFDMDMGPIQTCVVEGDTVAINYKMYMTPKADMGEMKKGQTIVLKVSEFNTFAELPEYDKPMVVHLQLLAVGM